MIKRGMIVANQTVGVVGEVLQIEDDRIIVDVNGKVHELNKEDCVLADRYRHEASRLFNVDYFSVTPAQRQAGKRFVFHQVYSMKGMKVQ